MKWSVRERRYSPVFLKFLHWLQENDQLQGKVKRSRYRPGVAQRVGRGIALLFHDRDTRRGWVVSSTPRSHFTPGKDPVPILQEAGWAPEPVWMGGIPRPHRDSIPDRPARSQSLYRLSYPAHNSCKPRPFYPRGTSTLYSRWRLDGPQSRISHWLRVNATPSGNQHRFFVNIPAEEGDSQNRRVAGTIQMAGRHWILSTFLADLFLPFFFLHRNFHFKAIKVSKLNSSDKRCNNIIYGLHASSNILDKQDVSGSRPVHIRECGGKRVSRKGMSQS